MLIQCPQCATAYDVNAGSLGAGGRTVRCAKCSTRWFAEAPQLADAMPATEMAMAAEWDAALAEAMPPASTATLPATASPKPPPAPSGDDDAADPFAKPLTDPLAAALADPLAEPLVSMPASNATPPPVPAREGQTIDAMPIVPIEAPERSEDIETVAARRGGDKAKGGRGRGVPLLLTILGLAGLLGGLVVWRTDVVRAAPQTASLYSGLGLPVNLRGLAFEGVTVSGETHENVPVMVVAGEIRNVAGQTVEIPRIRYALRTASGVEVYVWTAQPPQPVLGGGETVPFRTRLASPPPDGNNLQVRFFNRRDLESGR